MKKSLVAAAFLAGLVGPASAATILDFTSDNATSGMAGGTNYTVSATDALNTARDLNFTTHKNNVGCNDAGWSFDCAAVGSRYDVGFGVKGNNNNEIDAAISVTEYVQVTFDKAVKILGFAGMLAYNGSQRGEGTETVVLEYSADGGATWSMIDVLAFYDDNDPTDVGNDNFGTAGLAYWRGQALIANVVRFTAGGTSPFDDRTANVTAAGLIVAAVPVPASFPLLLAGIGALGWAARRKRKSS